MTAYSSILGALHAASVQFIIVGGAAATAHGASRLTLDLDIVYRRSDENLVRLADALAPLNPYLRGVPSGLPFQLDVRTIRNGMNFTLVTSQGDLDLLGEITAGGDYDQLLPHTVVLTLFGIDCHCLNLERLIHVKRAVGRPKDLEAIAELEAILEDRIDS